MSRVEFREELAGWGLGGPEIDWAESGGQLAQQMRGTPEPGAGGDALAAVLERLAS